jgi:hypothetical protein
MEEENTASSHTSNDNCVTATVSAGTASTNSGPNNSQDCHTSPRFHIPHCSNSVSGNGALYNRQCSTPEATRRSSSGAARTWFDLDDLPSSSGYASGGFYPSTPETIRRCGFSTSKNQGGKSKYKAHTVGRMEGRHLTMKKPVFGDGIR